MSLDSFCLPSIHQGTEERVKIEKFVEHATFKVDYGSAMSRQSLFHAFISAIYPVYTIMPRNEQHKFCRDCFETIGYAIDKNKFYERYKFSHLCKKSELQNKFLQFEDLSNDNAMQKVIANFFDVNVVVIVPSEQKKIQLIPPTFEYDKKACVVLEKRQNKYYPYTSNTEKTNFIPSQKYADIKSAFANFTERKKYSLKPYYTYKIQDLLELAKRFHVVCTKPGRYNKVVNKTKRELYDELTSIL
jgi:hypothetical protein